MQNGIIPHGTGGRLDGLCDALHGSVFLIAQRQHLPRFLREFIEAFLQRFVACCTIWLPLDECLSKLTHQRVKKYQTLPTLFAIMIRNARLGKPKRPRDERPRAIVFVETPRDIKRNLLDDTLGIESTANGREYVRLHR